MRAGRRKTSAFDIDHDLAAIRRRYFPNQPHRAFTFWAMQCYMAAAEPPDEFILERELDKGGDLGIDGYWIDDTNGRLVLFQSKYSAKDEAALGRRVVQEFAAACEALGHSDYINQHANTLLKDVYPEFFRSTQNYKLMVDRLLERVSRRPRKR